MVGAQRATESVIGLPEFPSFRVFMQPKPMRHRESGDAAADDQSV
jgi:hypothetical protein